MSGALRVDAVVNAIGSGEHTAVTFASPVAGRRAAGLSGRDLFVVASGEEGSAESARRAGATLCVLASDEARTPGAARNAGAAGTTADYLLFLDGDVELEEGFLRRAVAHLEQEAGHAGFGGRLDERHWRDGRQVGGASDLYGVGPGGPVSVLGALWLCRRSAFDAVGGFDPSLPSEEDFELSLRLRLAGHGLWAEGTRAGYHDCAPRPSLAELGRRWTSGLFAGQGLALRKYWGRPGFGELMSRQRLFFAALAFWAAGLVALGAAWAGKPTALAVWAASSLAAWLVMSARKRSARLGLLSLLTWTVQGVALVRSLAFGPWGRMCAAGRASR